MALTTIALLAGIAFEVLDQDSFSTVSGDSMQHGTHRRPGIIDDGDGIILHPVEERSDIVTYYEGQRSGYGSVGDFGDAIAFKAEPLERSFIHRAVFYFAFNRTGENATADIPELGILNATSVTLTDHGFKKETITIDFRVIYSRMQNSGYVVSEGYITKGDNRNVADQMGQPFVAPVALDKVSGLAEVLDNEGVSRSPLEYMGMVVLLLCPITLYAIWTGRWSQNKGLKRFDTIAKALCCILAGALLLRYLLFYTQEGGYGKLAVQALTLTDSMLIFAAMSLLKGHRSPRERQHPWFLAILPFAALIPYFFVFKLFPHIMSYTFMALLMTWSLYHLRPDRFFKRKAPNAPDQGFTYWGVTLGLTMVTYLFLLNYTLPPLVLFILGWVTCIGHGALRLWQDPRKT